MWTHAPKTHRCFGPIVRLLIATGQRREEIAGLQWDEVNREAREMRLSGERTKNGEGKARRRLDDRLRVRLPVRITECRPLASNA